MIRKVVSLSLALLIAGPLQAGRVVLNKELIACNRKQISCEHQQAKKSHTWSKIGLGGVTVSALGILLYMLFSGKQNNPEFPRPTTQAPQLPMDNGNIDINANMKAVRDQLYPYLHVQQPQNQSTVSWVAGGLMDFGKTLGSITMLGCVTMLASYLSNKMASALGTAQNYATFNAFVAAEKFDEDCEHLKQSIDILRMEPSAVEEERMELFVTGYDMFVKKIALLCGYLSLRAHQWKAQHLVNPARDLENCINVVCDQVQRCNAQVDDALQKAAQAERIESASKAIARLVEQMNNAVTHAKWIEQTAWRDENLMVLSRNI